MKAVVTAWMLRRSIDGYGPFHQKVCTGQIDFVQARDETLRLVGTHGSISLTQRRTS
jgi:hypothetical protein